jgi:hypothetical protein
MSRITPALLVALVSYGCATRPQVLDERSPFAAVAGSRPNACKAEDFAAAEAEWTKLRTSFPYHLQTIAVSRPFASGCRALVITEPPPGTGVSALQEVAPELLRNSTVERHVVGHDGWTADVVFTIPPLEARPLEQVVAQLHARLFGTTYRLQTIATDARPTAIDRSVTPLDVTVGPGDLNRWLLAETEPTFRSLRGGASVSFRSLLESETAGVYIDARHGLVSWVIPRGADIDDMRALVRQFAMESDLVVGAVGSKRSVAVVARRRVVDPLVLPPLRFETVSLLGHLRDADRNLRARRDCPAQARGQAPAAPEMTRRVAHVLCGNADV